MVTGYGGTYRGAVVDDADPMQQSRLGVVVPDVYGDGVSVWAVALQSSGSSLPAIGDLVLISFEHGDTDYPIWEPYSDAEQNGDAPSGYVGKYRASVVDNADPMQENRLQVIVPEIDSIADLGHSVGRRQIRRDARSRCRGVDRVRIRRSRLSPLGRPRLVSPLRGCGQGSEP